MSMISHDKPWVSAYTPGVPADIDPDQYRSLLDLFDQHVNHYRDRVACYNLGSEFSYNQLDHDSRALARYWQQQCGLNKGDRVAIMLPNLFQYPVSLLSILRAGLVVVNINPLYTAHELTHYLQDSGAKAIVVLDRYVHVLAHVIENSQIEHVLVTGVGDLLGGIKGTAINFILKYIKRTVPAYHLPQAVAFRSAIRIGDKLPWRAVALQSSDIAFLQYTGGTTGLAKGAELTHRNMTANVLQCMAWVRAGIPTDARVATAILPFYHIFALTVCCFCFLTLGLSLLLVVDPRDNKRLLSALKAHPISIFIGINTLFLRLLSNPKFADLDFSRLFLALGGGMPVQADIAAKWQSITGVPLLEGYGLTEASPVVCINPTHLSGYTGAVGLPISGTEVSIRDAGGVSVAENEPGELWVRGPQVMHGYWNNPQATAEVITEDGWLRTGDIARMDATGYVTVVDRQKDMILVSGFNVYPNEVEAVINSLSGVLESAVIGVPSEKTGEAVKAFVVLNGQEIAVDDIRAHCREYLTAYKIPAEIEFREDLPKSLVGKILRKALRDLNKY